MMVRGTAARPIITVCWRFRQGAHGVIPNRCVVEEFVPIIYDIRINCHHLELLWLVNKYNVFDVLEGSDRIDQAESAVLR
jgi:hypothetical protein